MTTIRAELPQKRKNRVIYLRVWGKLGQEVKNFYTCNDYILIEGYISLRSQKFQKLQNRNSKQIVINVLRIYPILLNPDRVKKKNN